MVQLANHFNCSACSFCFAFSPAHKRVDRYIYSQHFKSLIQQVNDSSHALLRLLRFSNCSVGRSVNRNRGCHSSFLFSFRLLAESELFLYAHLFRSHSRSILLSFSFSLSFDSSSAAATMCSFRAPNRPLPVTFQ